MTTNRAEPVSAFAPGAGGPLRVLVVDDEATIRTTLRICLEAAEHHVADFGTGGPALAAAAEQVFDLLFLDLRLGTENGLDYIPRFLEKSPWLKIVVITAYASIDTAVEAMRRGAADYLPKPFTPEQVELLAGRVAEVRALEIQVTTLQHELGAAEPGILFSSDHRAMRAAVELARTFAPSDTLMLFHGETGTGKRSLARAVHEWSPRRARPFMVLSCRQRPESEMSAELFGGSVAGREGPGPSRLDRCAGGTLYVDDLGSLPLRIQEGLLEVIQGKRFEREGSYAQVDADVRILLGSSTPAKALLDAGVVRQDLYYASAGNTVELPPLRRRVEDIAPLAERFLAFFLQRQGKAAKNFAADALAYLAGYSWPGNLRELRNIVERAAILARGEKVELTDFPPNMLQTAGVSAAGLGDLVSLESIEEQHIRGVLGKCGSLELAATILGIDGATLWRRRRKYGL